VRALLLFALLTVASALIVVGVWWMSPAVALIVAGVAVAVLSVVGLAGDVGSAGDGAS